MVFQAVVFLGGTSRPLSVCHASAWSASVMATGFVLFSVLIITLFFFVVSVVVPSITVFYTIIHELQPESMARVSRRVSLYHQEVGAMRDAG